MDIRQLSLPGGIGLTHLTVYNEPGPDGTISGSPHVHLVSSEMYYVLAGSGGIELLSPEGLSTIELFPNKVVSFRPGIIHRLLNPNKNLQILVIMQNGGLPEKNDQVVTLPDAVLASEEAYWKTAKVTNMTEAIARRNQAIEGYKILRDAMLQDKAKGAELIRKFYERARKLMLPRADGFEWVVKSGAQAECKDSLDAIDFLRVGRMDYLEKARYAEIFPMNDPVKYGMTGTRHPFALDKVYLAEGKKVA